ncbi:2'-5' RNA ligase family protein [Paenibacillus turpanensis]|uniref:2'-5' RNA ligase family protein n=1 Tax=Paenibacillus turpanensis TaxID=2689078 RepID=UPI001407444C|nr:2'-5' RNA ligase family protein [Paenibacillus turpanensis]
MNYGIAVFPSREAQDYANSFRKRYDTHYSLIQPHLTVRESEDWSEARLQEAVEHITRIAQTIAPFDAKLNRFSSFYPVNNVIYLALEENEPFQSMVEAVCSGPLAETNRRYGYNPHLTVGQELSDDELHDVLSSLRKKPVNLPFKVDRLHLLYQTDNKAWTVYQTFLLQGQR